MRIERILILISALICVTSGLYYIKQRDNTRSKIIVYRLWHMGLITISLPLILLLSYQVFHHFEFSYVYEHTSLDLPYIYRISALWSGKEGSFLVWAFILVIMGYFMLKISYSFYTKAFPIYVGITVALLMMSFITNPFKILNNTPSNGLGLNLALQDPWMVIHPPLVFVGYTAMAIIFALGIGEVEEDKLLKQWIRISMLFLGLGIITGSIWAYGALGWGGYWAWDPIENIALVPWLLLCAYAHGKVKMTKLKCILPFSIAAFGTFLVRSGLLQGKSAHAYVGQSSSWTTIILVSGVIVAIILIVYGINQNKRKINKAIQKDDLIYFRLVTYLYAFIILIATVLPLFWNYEVTVTFYNNLTLGYVIANSLLIIKLEKDKVGKKGLLSIIISALLSICIAKSFQCANLSLVIILWITLIPLMGYLLTHLQRKKSYYYWTHVLLLFMLIGGITSAGMGAQYMDVIGQQEAAGLFREGKTTIISSLVEDQVIDTITYDNHDSNATIVYESKPLIALFWIGSFGLLGTIGIKILKN